MIKLSTGVILMPIPSLNSPKYFGGNDGNIWSSATLGPNTGTKVDGFRKLKGITFSSGYLYVSIPCGNKNIRKVSVAKLICEAFHGTLKGLHTRHLNGDKLNNSPENLSWGTCQDNANDRMKHGMYKKGAENSLSKFSQAQRDAICAAYSLKEISSKAIREKFNVSVTTFYRVIKNEPKGQNEKRTNHKT